MEQELRTQGWEHDPSEGLIAFLGGLWLRERDGMREFGFIALPHHANRNGVVHGGMMMTFVDRAFGMTSRGASGAARGSTISLSHQFMNPLKIGSFATVQPRIGQLTRRMSFVEGTLMCGETPIMQSQGVWRLAVNAD